MGFANNGDTSREENEEGCSRSNPRKAIHSPTGINDQGWIVGTGMNAQGDSRAFVLQQIKK